VLSHVQEARTLHLQNPATDTEIEKPTPIRTSVSPEIVPIQRPVNKPKKLTRALPSLPVAPVIPESIFEEIIEQPDAGNLVLDIPVASCTRTVIPSSTSNFMEEDTSSLLKALLTRLTRMELKIDNLSKDIQLLKKLPAVPTVKPQEYPDLPLTTDEQLDSFNCFLGDEDGFSYFVNTIAITGENGEKDRVLAIIIKNYRCEIGHVTKLERLS
ncbi:unnamed protein product, partial [Allacma fusca]